MTVSKKNAPSTLVEKWRPAFLGVVGALLFATAWIVVHRELRLIHYHEVINAVHAIPASRLWLAVLLTVAGYIALTGYDRLALNHIQRSLDYGKIAFTSFVSYVFSYNVGLSLFGATAIRYRMYSAWGMSAAEVARITAFCVVTLWLGFFSLAGVVFLAEPIALGTRFHLPFATARPVGLLFLLIVSGYFFITVIRKTPLKIWRWEFPFPSWKMSLAQMAVSCADWSLAAMVLFVLNPTPSPVSFPAFLGVFLLAQFIGLISHVPGGLGVFEGVMLVFLSPTMPPTTVLGMLLVYRAVYYLLPLFLAITLLSGFEFSRRTETFRKVAYFYNERVSGLVPSVFSTAIFLCGVVLLFSGATPVLAHRLNCLGKFMPLPLLELSHFVGSLAGVGLLFLAWGLQRRLDAAYPLTLTFLALGIGASLVKGLDYEEALFLTIMGMALLPCRRLFYRHTSLLKDPFSPGWTAAIAVVIAGSVWLGFFSFKRIDYSNELWWRFEFSGDAPRFLRASVGAVSLFLVLGIARLLKPVFPLEPNPPNILEKVLPIVASSPDTSAYLALLGDKRFLFSEDGKGFLMYAVQGKSWIALGDPVGSDSAKSELVWRFREMCDRYRTWPAFYEVSKDHLPLYLDVGMTLLKIGEEARVSLGSFSIDGSDKKNLRYIYNKHQKEGYQIRMLSIEETSRFLPKLKEVSDAWLADKKTREKGFSLGYFEEDYLERFPVAVVEKEGRVTAFSNLWLGGGKEELSIDLMRHTREAPRGVMDYLFIHLMLWGKQEGYRWFNLGMAPFSGFQDHALAPLWSRLGLFLFQHGEHFYNFQGLRQYKEKFHPEWNPKYLASPGGLALPRILGNIAVLISGGVKGMVSK